MFATVLHDKHEQFRELGTVVNQIVEDVDHLDTDEDSGLAHPH